MKCNLCPRSCNAERNDLSNLNGYCKMPLLPKAARAALHFWEEPCISGTNGSGTVFFSGCSLGCIYCQNYEISHNGFGKSLTPERLSEIFKTLENSGAHNINLVNPTHFALSIRDALRIYRPNIPIVYNSGGYDKVDTLKALEGYVDMFLTDFKYFSSDKAHKYSDAYNYPDIVKSALKECYRQIPECSFDQNGIMQKGVIVRHLILPQATRDAISVFDWVKENLPNAYFSLMSQYIPMYKAFEDKVIGRKITEREYEKVISHIIESGFENCYIQERNSANMQFVPDFDLSGV